LNGTAAMQRAYGDARQPASPGVPASMQPVAPPASPAPGGAAPQPGGIDPRASLLAYLGAKSSIAGLGDTFKPFETALYNSPTYKAAVAAAEAAGKLPYVGPTAAAEAQGKAPYTWNTLRPGQLGGYGGNMTVAAPTLQKVVDPVSGQESYRYIAPPVGPQSAAPGASADLGVAALGPGQRRALETRADKEQADRQQVISEANLAQQSRATLLNMQE
jgi:hypothetical protein